MKSEDKRKNELLLAFFKQLEEKKINGLATTDYSDIVRLSAIDPEIGTWIQYQKLKEYRSELDKRYSKEACEISELSDLELLLGAFDTLTQMVNLIVIEMHQTLDERLENSANAFEAIKKENGGDKNE